MTKDKSQPGLPVVEVDQAFPLMTADSVARPASASGSGDQGPAVSAAIRDVLGWRPRVQDPQAFTAALSASFELSTFEDHVIAKYVPRGVAVQADLGGVTGGQASLYLRAKAAHEQITRMLDSLQPLRTDADPQDCEAYRTLVRDSVRRIVTEFGREGGPRVPLVDSAFGVLTGFNPAAPASAGGEQGTDVGLLKTYRPQFSVNAANRERTTVPAAKAEVNPDTIPGQLGALRDRFGLDDDHVNTVDEEKQRTSFWTLVELVTDLQNSWSNRRIGFTLGAGSGFLGTDLIQISRLLAATSEQVDEFEAVLDSVLVSGAERQTVVLDRSSGLTLDDVVQWLRVFVTQDGPNIIRDTGRDGLVSTFTPTAIDLLHTLRDKLVLRLVPCGSPSCANGCHCGSRRKVTCIPLGCCTPLPPGMYSGRVKIAVSTLCGLMQGLTAKAIRIGRYAGAVLLDLALIPFDSNTNFIRVEVRGLHLRPTYIPAFVVENGSSANFADLVLPLQDSASADDDHLSGIFQRDALPARLTGLLPQAGSGGVLIAASEVPLAVLDGELGRVVSGPAVTTWPRLRPADDQDLDTEDDLPTAWTDIDPNQRFVPQSAPDPIDPIVTDDECLDGCSDDCKDCDCGCHDDQFGGSRQTAGGTIAQSAGSTAADPGIPRWQAMAENKNVRRRAAAVLPEFAPNKRTRKRMKSALKGKKVQKLMNSLAKVETERVENALIDEQLMLEADVLEQSVDAAKSDKQAANDQLKHAKRSRSKATKRVDKAKKAKKKALRKVVRAQRAAAKAQRRAQADAERIRKQ
ncbi:hypothetical protein [Kribbella soli]|uniref:Uncharacterized protein n=1 Tax=Kribbella soli TaxID=1124743 RepID=A0A4R0HGH2_9ACTN|nr:hypothetical protein [Kribbella soli]TCC07982.1 hypothetical protein E0H45_18815 [Kribbella soli]